MSVQAVKWVLYHIHPHELSYSEFRVLTVMADHADPQGKNIYPSVSTLTDWCQLSKRTVQYALKALEKKNFISRDNTLVMQDVQKQYRPIVWKINMNNSANNNMQMVEDDYQPDSDSGVQSACTSRGAKTPQSGVQSGVQSVCTQNHITHITQKEKAERENSQPTTTQNTIDNWHPNANHEQQAHQTGINLAEETENFRLHTLANGKHYANTDAAFTLWLNHAANRNKHNNQPPHSKHIHTWTCSHTLQALNRQPDQAQPDQLAQTAKNLLNSGQSVQQVQTRLLTHKQH